MSDYRSAAVCLLICFIAASAAKPARADDFSPGDTIVGGATRNEIQKDSAIVPVDVISRNDIELSMARDLGELLRFTAGIDIARNGGPGQASSAFLRGTESNHMLVLIDGVRMNPGTIGGAAIQNMSPETIQRIEIVKGARSALYGTDAIGGVVNIITRQSDKDFVQATASGGSFNTRGASVAAGEHGDLWDFGATIDWQDTDGFPTRTDSDVASAYENLSASLSATRRFRHGELSLRHWRAGGTVGYLDFFLTPLDQDFTNSITSLQLDNDVSKTGKSKLIISTMRDRIAQNQSDDYVESDRASLDWQYSQDFTDHLVSAGLFLSQENAKSLSFGSGFDEDTNVSALFVQDQWARGAQSAFVAARLTDHETFGRQFTWNLEYAYAFSDAWRVQGSLGRAFRAPDATDRYGYGGDPNLLPEVAKEYQVGLHYTPANRHSIELGLYRTDIDDLIEFDLATFMLANIDRARITGAELGYQYSGNRFVLHSTVVSQRADNETTGNRLPRRAEHSATLSYEQAIGPHQVGVSLLASGEREDVGNLKLAGYMLVNLTAKLHLSRSWQLNGKIENLFDRDYQTAAGYRMQGRSAYIEVRYSRH